MKKLFAIFFSLLSLSANSFAADNDNKTVNASVNGFYLALNKMFTGEMAPMEKVWSHRDDITYMGPDGAYVTGWSAIKANLQGQADKKLGGHVQPKDIQVTIGKDLAIVSNYEIGENVDATGKPAKVEIRATSLFRKEGSSWKMIGHHTDTLAHLKQ